MERSGASAYIFAKASGILARSYIGQNAQPLFEAKSLSELWELIFKTSAPQMPETLLASQIETEAVKAFVKQYVNFLKVYTKPDSILVEILRRYDVENLKVLSAALSLGEEKRPGIVNLEEYSVLDYDAWPDLSKITRNNRFDWYKNIEGVQQRQKMDYQLDLQEFRILTEALDKVKDGSKEVLKDFYIRRYAVKNMLWALRLRVYYKMDAQQIKENLFYTEKIASKIDPICTYAFDVLDKPLDDFEAWRSWKFADFLNPHEEDNVWSIDPVWIEQRLRVEETRVARNIFHANPMTDVTMAMFYELKQQELNCIRASVEGLRLGSDAQEMMSAAGLSVKNKE